MKAPALINDVVQDVFERERKKISLDSSPYWENPVGIQTFIESKDYLNANEEIRPAVKEDLLNIFQFDELGNLKYHEVVFDEGIGSGKSYKSSVIATYVVYRILCLKDPQKFYRLAPGSKIAVMNMSLTATHAKDIVFGQISSRISQCKWFAKHGLEPDPAIKSVLRFPKDVYIIPGSSQETAPAGYDIVVGIIDEAAWYPDTEGHDVAEEIYYNLQRRGKSRFMKHWLLVMLSSPRYTDDFIERKGKEAENSSEIFFVRRPTWRSQMQGTYNGETFSYGVYNDIPIELKSDFDKKPMRALRDLGAIPSLVLEPFFEEYERVKNNVNHSRVDLLPELVGEDDEQIPESPIEQLARLLPMSANPSFRYYIHVDLATGGADGSGCRCGFCIGHVKSVQYRGSDALPIGCIDLMTRFKASPSREIQFEEVREFIMYFKNRGFHIEKCTYDGFQGIDSIQLLKNKGVNAEILSVQIDAYETMKEMIYSQRLDYYGHKGFLTECQRLERKEGNKIVKPAKGCFTGDTKIALLDGRNLSFIEIIEEYNQGKDLWVYSIDVNTQKIVPKRIGNPRKTGENVIIFEVVLDTGEKIKCTEDHLFMLRAGSYREARYLQQGESLMPLYREVSKKGMAGYELLYDPFTNKKHYTHVYTTSAIKRGQIRHHKDFNPLNNNPTNIEVICKSVHASLHSRALSSAALQKRSISKKRWHQENRGTLRYREIYKKVSKSLTQRDENFNSYQAVIDWIKGNNLWEDYQWLRKRFTRCKRKADGKRLSHENLIRASRAYNITRRGIPRTEEVKKHMREACKRRTRQPSYNKGKTIEELFSPEVVDTIRMKNSKAHKGQIPWCKNLTKETDARIMQISLKNIATKLKMSTEGKIVAWNKGLTKETDERVRINVERSAVTQRRNNLVRKLELSQSLNHKVISVNKCGYADVYDIEIEGTQNFALSAGVFVHNSKDLVDSVAGVCKHLAESLLPGNKKRPRKFEGRAMVGGVGTRRTTLFGVPREQQTLS